ncbi:hypothetical protein CAC42_5889 [Sphaceloma murrayae]|uniref:Integral membrane protein n=1 Tax=Sphaceloma murrayae TaxID=2082308 RepID=A0A2K1QZJ1_9PEZI|nr:hypothetical protein CAC42_5889 [Sphaceloma murrayae]
MASKLSQSSALLVIANILGTLTTGFGINAILRPDHALTFFEMAAPTGAADRKLVDSLMIVYGIRDVFMGLAIYATAFYGARKPLAWCLMGLSGVAFTDGLVCYMNGKGEWNHWGYTPLGVVVGALLLGAADR